MMANKTKTVTICAFDIFLEEDFDTTLSQIENGVKEWRTDEKYLSSVRIVADEYHASCNDFNKTAQTLEVSLSRSFDNLPHTKKENQLPEPMILDANTEAVGVTYLKFYFAKKICLFVSTKDVSTIAPARFIEWNKKILGSGAELLQKFTVQAHLKKDTVDALKKLGQIKSIDLNVADLPNQEDNESKKKSWLNHAIAFNGKLSYEKNTLVDSLLPEIKELLTKKPKKLIVHGTEGKKQVNLTNEHFRISKKIKGKLTAFNAFQLLSDVFKEEFEE